MLPTRENLTLVATALKGSPYIWGGKGMEISVPTRHPSEYLCFDCFGFGAYVISACGGRDLRFSHWTDLAYKEWPIIERVELKPFDAVFYGKENDPDHVMWYMGHGVVIGAHGGGRLTAQIDPKAKVSLHSIAQYRYPAGFRSIRDLVANP